MVAQLVLLTLLSTLTWVARCGIPPLEETIGQAIFHEGSLPLSQLSPTSSTSATTSRTPTWRCSLSTAERTSCAPSSTYFGTHSGHQRHAPAHQRVRQGGHSPVSAYPQRRQLPKVHPSPRRLHLRYHRPHPVPKIQQFYSAFEAGTLERHFSSEAIPSKDNDPYLKKVVGRTFKDFSEGPAPVKVLYLYSDNEGCSTCKDVYDLVVAAAKAFPGREQVAFGALDLFRNEHELLEEHHIPVVLVYLPNGQKMRLQELDEIEKLEGILAEHLNHP
jgi:hypothetical protein